MNNFTDICAFIRNSFDEPSAFIPLHDPRFIGNERKYLADAMDSNFVSSVGAYVTRFEKMCAEYTGAKYAVAAVNGTSALHIALLLAGVERDDEVLTQALTFIATANAISYTGAQPVFLDVDKDTLGLSPAAVEKWLSENAEIKETELNDYPDELPKSSTTSYLPPPGELKGAFNKKTGRRIAACIPMHTFGHPVKIKALKALLDAWHIPLVEDAAESMGSYVDGQHTGTFGLLGVISFNGNKIITTGGGGMILTDNEELAIKAKHMTTQAKIPHAWEFKHNMIGYNYRLTNLAAALGCGQIESLPRLLELKRELANQYITFFANSDFQFVTEPEGCISNYWLNAIITKDREQRDELLQFTNSLGVMTRPIWELMTRLEMFKHCQTDDLANSIWLADRVVNIPSSAIIPGYYKN